MRHICRSDGPDRNAGDQDIFAPVKTDRPGPRRLLIALQMQNFSGELAGAGPTRGGAGPTRDRRARTVARIGDSTLLKDVSLPYDNYVVTYTVGLCLDLLLGRAVQQFIRHVHCQRNTLFTPLG